MLNPEVRIAFDAVPGVLIFPDDREAIVFYGIPEVPRLVRDDQGLPAIRFLLFEENRGEESRALGGQLSLTASLGLEPTEIRDLKKLLSRHPLEQAASAEEGDQRELEIRSPDWLEGQAEVQLSGQLSLSGKTSSFGENLCAMAQHLTVEQALQLREAWDKGLPEASITYRVICRAGPAVVSNLNMSWTSSRERHDPVSRESTKVSVRFQKRGGSARYSLDLKGPLVFDDETLQRCMTILSM